MRRKLRKILWYLLTCTFIGNIFLFVLHLSVNESSLMDIDTVKSRAEQDWEHEQTERLQLMQKTCREVRESDDRNPWKRVARSVSESMLVDEVDEVLFCPSPHHRSTAWTSALNLLVRTYTTGPSRRNAAAASSPEREDRILDKRPTDNVQFSNQRQLRGFLQRNDKILFVVHPFDRLLAVFQDRFSNVIENRRSQYWNRLRRKILRLNYPGASEEQLVSQGVKFDEYIQYLVFRQEHNVHWSVTYDLCHPCDIEYDYVVKLETLATDIKYLSKKLYGSSEAPPIIQHGQQPPKRNSLAILQDFYRLPSLNSLLYLYDIYSLDFYMYNYTWPFQKLTL